MNKKLIIYESSFESSLNTADFRLLVQDSLRMRQDMNSTSLLSIQMFTHARIFLDKQPKICCTWLANNLRFSTIQRHKIPVYICVSHLFSCTDPES